MSGPSIASPSNVVIVGAGQAGFWVAKTLRDRGFAHEVVLLGDETHPPYERPPLSKGFLDGTLEDSKTYFASTEALMRDGVDFRPNSRVIRIDRKNKRVELRDGGAVRYGSLVLATGGRGRLLPPDGMQSTILYLRSIEDAIAIRGAMDPMRPLLIIGGGWIGLEIAAAARKRNIPVTLVESAPVLCGRALPHRLSGFLLNLHRAHNVDVRLNCNAAQLLRGSALLSSGETVPAAVIVAGIGMIPNSEVASEAGLDVDSGIVVDEFCRTSDPAILAAGDVARYPSKRYRRSLRLESWHNAQTQGVAAAMTILGEQSPHDSVPWFWSEQYDVNLQVSGIPEPGDMEVIRGDARSNTFSVYYLRGQQMVAAISINQARENRIARKLIEKAINVAPGLIEDPRVELHKLIRSA